MQKDGLDRKEWDESLGTYTAEKLGIKIKKMLKSDPNLVLIDLGDNEILQAYCNGQKFDFLQSTLNINGHNKSYWTHKLYKCIGNKYSETDLCKGIDEATKDLLGISNPEQEKSGSENEK